MTYLQISFLFLHIGNRQFKMKFKADRLQWQKSIKYLDDSNIYVEVQRNEDNENNLKEREGEGIALPDDFLQRLPAEPGQGRRRAVQSGQQAPARPTPGQALAPEPDAVAAQQGGRDVREKTLTHRECRHSQAAAVGRSQAQKHKL